MAKPQVTEFAAAKVNLCLHVTGQRADGYHLLDSLVTFAGVGDRLTAYGLGADPGAGGGAAVLLELGGPFGPSLPRGGDNLVLRAAQKASDLPISFYLEKNLPPASGIGGGSADAAAALRAVRRLAGLDPIKDVARDILAALGADVPVCLQSIPARMRGIGEVFEPVRDLPKGWILLVNPRVEVPTPVIFRALSEKNNPGLPQVLPQWADLAALCEWLGRQRNDLEAPAIAAAPVIEDVLKHLRACEGQLLARMSGSGATCFALFEREQAAQSAAHVIQNANPGWWVAAAPLLH